METLRHPHVCFHIDSKPSLVDREDELCLPGAILSVRVSAEKSAIILMCWLFFIRDLELHFCVFYILFILYMKCVNYTAVWGDYFLVVSLWGSNNLQNTDLHFFLNIYDILCNCFVSYIYCAINLCLFSFCTYNLQFWGFWYLKNLCTIDNLFFLYHCLNILNNPHYL